mgnify:CR=1 FL=1
MKRFSNIDELRKAIAIYAGFKYILIFPGRNEAMVYDRERTCWVGPWTFDANSATIYYDDSGNETNLDKFWGNKYFDCVGNIINNCSNGVTGLFSLKMISLKFIKYL